MSGKLRTPGLYEFLQEAELQHYFNGLKNILQVQNVPQLKYVVEEDLRNIGMSKPECRRLKTFFNKYCPGNYASKLRKFLGRKEDGKEEFLLGEEAALGSRSAIKVPSQHVIQADAISIYKELGQGEFGIVQQGVWTDDDGMRHQVAVKCLSKERMQNNTLEFMKEYEIMQAIDHKHIVRLYGVILDAAQIMLITELAPLRSLLECLKESSLRTTFTVSCLGSFSQQICQGMMYLESKRLIHRDLAARNILVYSKDTVKISDFGLSRALGVGKDYYQTNFNVNLKLPIAWCAPECINFLKFTTSSDVWAFAVTMWEMFSYGFQPWAALTGHQILEAIDEPGGQRLEQPVHCPREYYQVMEACWKHKPQDRPAFAQVLGMLEEAKPEQVQVVVSGGGGGLLEYQVGEILTVLDKHNVSGGAHYWSGVNATGKVGWFVPSHTVSYLGNLPGSGVVPQWSSAPEPQFQTQSSSGSMFHRSSLRTSRERKGSNRKISRDMISGPTGNVQHTGHVGPDGCYFGDVTFISGTNGHLTMTNRSDNLAMSGRKGERSDMTMSMSGRLPSDQTMSGRLPSSGSENGFSSLSRADSDVSESAPLIASATVVDKPAPPRMGHAIGYLRKPEKEVPPADPKTHQYQSISDEENEPFGSPLDLGPSLLDEVFSELNYDTLKINKEEKKDDTEEHHGLGHNIVDSCHKLADKVSTLTLSRRHKGKKAAFVKPITAADAKTLDNAILMANQLASKSMQDLDKRCVDDMFNASPQVSPLTPNSPTKKFTFKFPSSKTRSTSPKNSARHFSDEVASNVDLESYITPTARDAYKALIDGNDASSYEKTESSPSSKSSTISSSSHNRLSLPPSSNIFSFSKLSIPQNIESDSIPEGFNTNPLPLPPKDRKSSVTAGKRHIRKNPLIMTSGAAASMARRFETDEPAARDDPEPLYGAGHTNTYTQKTKNTQKQFSPTNDAFEDEIACSIDALDNIPESKYNSPKTSLEHSPPLVHYNRDHVSCEDLLEFSPRDERGKGHKRGLESDEVRIMSKVLGGVTTDKAGCLQALDLTDWNVHRAIKLVKLKALINKPGVKDNEMKLALINHEWDVAKAAGEIMKR
eukprot:GFUD01129951.1.p1 GENE.GFUD01129951.1~~GFUD01129951.1.p1  ORF type:complete len:1100 (+),score=246.67 GFUD01129951.1:50-3349(+)